jgi:large conductance mechanosensitive channel
LKKFVGEFKAFIMRGNVLDLAVGVIIASAFGKITASLVNDLLMPFIGLIIGGTDAASALNVTVRPAVLDASGNILEEATVLGFGTFLNTVIDFVIIAFIVFCIVKAFNKARSIAERKKEEKPAAPSAPPAPSREELLLTEIRDLLKDRK